MTSHHETTPSNWTIKLILELLSHLGPRTPLHLRTNLSFFKNTIWMYFQSQEPLTSQTLKTISFGGVVREVARGPTICTGTVTYKHACFLHKCLCQQLYDCNMTRHKNHTLQLDYHVDIRTFILPRPLHFVTLHDWPFYSTVWMYFQSREPLTSWTSKTISFEGVVRELQEAWQFVHEW